MAGRVIRWKIVEGNLGFHSIHGHHVVALLVALGETAVMLHSQRLEWTADTLCITATVKVAVPGVQQQSECIREETTTVRRPQSKWHMWGKPLEGVVLESAYCVRSFILKMCDL